MLDIHDYNGQLALKEADLMDEFRAIILEGRQATRVLDRDGTVLLDKPDDGTGGRPEVQRGELPAAPARLAPGRHRALGPQGHRRPHLDDGRHEVAFADGSTVVTGLLVGADGAWSRVRPLLSDATPTYFGRSFVETYLYDSETRHPAAAKAVGGGSLFALAPDTGASGKWIGAHRESGETLHAYVALAEPQEWFAAIDFTDAAASTARIAAEFEGWAPRSPP